jgi:hypothetical protein
MLLAIFGIDGGALSLVVNLLVLFLIVTYLVLIYWTYLDAKRRIEDPVLIACATAASMFPFVGTVVYTILRPPEFIEDRQERELELRASELRLRELIEQSCPHCEYPIDRTFLRCPNCERRVRNPCSKCRKPLDPRWGICPYCETEVRRPRAEGREPARRAERPGRPARTQRSGRAARPSRPERPVPAQRTPGQRASGRRAVGGPGSGVDGSATRPSRPTVPVQGRPQQRPTRGSLSG